MRLGPGSLDTSPVQNSCSRGALATTGKWNIPSLPDASALMQAMYTSWDAHGLVMITLAVYLYFPPLWVYFDK